MTVRPWVALLCACAAGQAMAYRPFNGTDADTAGAVWREALRRLNGLEHPEAESLRARIRAFAVPI